MTEEFCICKHPKNQHTHTNGKHWARFQNQLVGYNDHDFKDREKFWGRFFNEGSDDEWRCAKCKCDSFRLDNLKWIEDLAKEKKLI